MHVVLAPDSFAGTLTAHQAAEAMARGWGEAAPHDLLTLVPLSDGGPGFLDVLASALPDARTLALTVTDPLGREVPAALLLVDEEDGCTAYVEAAQAAGLHLLAADERNPGVTSSWGVGRLLDAALTEGATTVVVGVGGSATHDGGAGLLAALGVGTHEDLARGGLALSALTDGALAGVDAVRDRWAGIRLVLATDDELPLLGLQGASAVDAPRRGASPELAQQLEHALGRWVEVVRRTVPEATDLLTGRARRLDKEPGAGAGGGLGYALYLLGARRSSGVEEVVRAVGLGDLLAAADLVVTGEGSFDWQSLQGRVVAGVAAAALDVATPCVVVAGQVLVGRREAMTLGLSGATPWPTRPTRSWPPWPTRSAPSRRARPAWRPPGPHRHADDVQWVRGNISRRPRVGPSGRPPST